MQKEECARSPPPVSLFTNPLFSFNKCECLQKQGDDYEDFVD
jgi:hypothetical protein